VERTISAIASRAAGVRSARRFGFLITTEKIDLACSGSRKRIQGRRMTRCCVALSDFT
jgi:hypothetical protein